MARQDALEGEQPGGPKPPPVDAGGPLNGLAAAFAPARIMEELRREAESPSARPLPERLRITEITVHEELFQPRGLAERHVSELVRAIRAEEVLDPVTIFPAGERLVLIDGHHRVEAYKRTKREEPIPVTYFEGTLKEAVVFSGRENSKAKLPMTTAERQQYAWRLTVLGEHTRAEIIAASGASRSQIANMRRAKLALGARALLQGSWFKARRAWALLGKKDDQEVDDDWKEVQAAQYADRLQSEFHNKLSRNIEVAAMALSIYFGRTLPDLYSELAGHLSEANVEDVQDVPDDF